MTTTDKDRNISKLKNIDWDEEGPETITQVWYRLLRYMPDILEYNERFGDQQQMAEKGILSDFPWQRFSKEQVADILKVYTEESEFEDRGGFRTYGH